MVKILAMIVIGLLSLFFAALTGAAAIDEDSPTGTEAGTAAISIILLIILIALGASQ